MPAKYKMAVRKWTYLKSGQKPKKTKLRCETVFTDVQQALREGEPCCMMTMTYRFSANILILSCVKVTVHWIHNMVYAGLLQYVGIIKPENYETLAKTFLLVS